MVGLFVGTVLAASNPGRQAHRDALGGDSFCNYRDYLFFSTMSVMQLDGRERWLSTGFLGTVYSTGAVDIEAVRAGNE